MGSLFGFLGSPDHELLGRMDQTLSHRGGADLFEASSGQGSLAVRPLNDLVSPEDRGEGLYSENGMTLALAGHLTNFRDFKSPILPELLAMYRKSGPEFVKKVRGAFAMAVLDGDRLYLFRDRAGARTIYYGPSNGRWLFAIEPKGVLADPEFPRRIRPGAVAQYLTFSFIPGPMTMLEDLREIPPGHWVTCRPGRRPEVRSYFEFEALDKEAGLSPRDWAHRFRDILSQAIDERLPKREPVGLFLSGGIDSSVVAAELVRHCDRPVKTYAIHFGPKYAHELDFARAAAERTGTEHAEVLLRPKDFLPRLRKIIWHLDDPIGDPITVPNFELTSKVSGEVACIYNGEGGDPLFGGPKNIPMMLEHWYGGYDRPPFFREQAYLASYRRCYDDLEQLLSPDWRKMYDSHEELEGVLTPFFNVPRPAAFLDKLQAINIRLKGAHLILPKVDRMIGAWGLRVMSPLFDERLIELSFMMPPRMKLDRGIEKVVLKEAYKKDLPPEVVARPKSGMRVPVHFWFKREMRRHAKRILSPKSLRETGIFNEQRVKQLLKYDIDSGPGRYGLRLWMLITFELWRRIVVKGEATGN